jgi:hypothetical protein
LQAFRVQIKHARMGGMRGYMTLKEMAERLGHKNSDGLRSQIRFGALHAEKVGRDWVVSEQEYARYVLGHAGKPGRKKKVETP